ncbi:hypothetical protein BU17DRAFT_81503 [Hysterangium stoloniferum]|nr:hypothetical protein BU17DRAFT_81503 [Hysterangium stoloniferum]
MKFTLPVTLLSVIVSTCAQISFISPPFDSVVHAGRPFNVSVELLDTITDVYNTALVLGQQPIGDPSNRKLGQLMTTVSLPGFKETGPKGELFVQNVSLTFPVGTKGLVNVTCAQFYTVGSDNYPSIYVTKTRVNVY